eukprot:355035-Chlamydomonas_euryale.AAC.4
MALANGPDELKAVSGHLTNGLRWPSGKKCPRTLQQKAHFERTQPFGHSGTSTRMVEAPSRRCHRKSGAIKGRVAAAK